MSKKAQDKREKISLSKIKDELHWTDAMIRDLLGDPVETKPNPKYPTKGRPMKLWYKEDVLRIMDTDEFKTAFEKANKKSRSQRQAAERKKQELIEYAIERANRITVPVYPDDEVRSAAIASKGAWDDFQADLRNRPRNCLPPSEENVEEEHIIRWVVNFIRHKLIPYDEDIEDYKGQVGKREAYLHYNKIVLEKIAAAYPKYADECKRQIKMPIKMDE